MSISIQNVTKSRAQTQVDILDRAADIGTVYLAVAGGQQEISVTHEKNGFSVVATAHDPNNGVSCKEQYHFSLIGKFVSGTTSERNSMTGQEHAAPLDEKAAQHILNHLDRLTGRFAMGSSRDPYADLVSPGSGNLYRY